MTEIWRRDYDNPNYEDGSPKSNTSLGFFDIIENLLIGSYESLRIGVKDGDVWLIVENEVTGINGGSITRVYKINNLAPRHGLGGVR